MTFTHRARQQIMLAVLVGILVGCLFGSIAIGAMVLPTVVRAALAPAPTPTLTATRVIYPTITLAPTATRTPTSTPIPSATATILVTQTISATLAASNGTPVPTRTPSPSRTPRPVVQHFVLGRPVPPNAQAVIPALSYLYGTTSMNQYDVHHGEEFVNPTGTLLQAVADGTVVVAGNDARRLCGEDGQKTCGRDLNFYGNLVVIQLVQGYNGQPLFALYGHMNRINVNEGDQVKSGDVIGDVGMTGIALGPHVHLEVRLETNDYAHTRNPILWMTPLPGRGAIAGRYLDPRGSPVRGAVINLSRADPENFLYSTETYGHDEFPPINSDNELGENFAAPDLLPGEYIVRVSGQPYAVRVTVQEGKLSFVEIGGP